ncbi:hypothetical protein BX666DRAFT_3985 [Dichotomocladium elegans]|nr:hypothetical protein BX666DRAFT_3985 [Dichotomocladium elegans]
MSDDALRAQFEQKETYWKEQIANLHGKLTQAGNHLKTLAQENARLIKSINEREAAEQQKERQILELSNTALGLLGEDPLTALPSNNAEGFVATLKQRLEEDRKKADATIKALEDRVKELTDDSKAASETVLQRPPEDKFDTSMIIASLKSVMDDDDETVFPSSLPLEVRSSLEDMKEKWIETKVNAKKEHKAAESVQNGESDRNKKSYEILNAMWNRL